MNISQMSSLYVIFKIHKSALSTHTNFRHPTLTKTELQYGCKLDIDSWADTCCAGRHAHVLEFIEGKTVSATGFSSELGSLTDLSMANVAYAYDTPHGEILILIVNNAIYLVDHMTDSLAKPVQCMDNTVQIDIRPRFYYPTESTTQTMHFPSENMTILIEYEGPLPYITIRRPTQHELDSCHRLTLNSSFDWDPYNCDRTVASTSTTITDE